MKKKIICGKVEWERGHFFVQSIPVSLNQPLLEPYIFYAWMSFCKSVKL